MNKVDNLTVLLTFTGFFISMSNQYEFSFVVNSMYDVGMKFNCSLKFIINKFI